jgi:hypothetical protein
MTKFISSSTTKIDLAADVFEATGAASSAYKEAILYRVHGQYRATTPAATIAIVKAGLIEGSTAKSSPAAAR